MLKYCHLLIAFIALTGCAQNVRMPENVELTPANAGRPQYVLAINFSADTAISPIDGYRKARLCIAEKISNDTVTLADSSHSFIGPATGRYYQIDSAHPVAGGATLQASDDELKTVIAKGSTHYSAGPSLLAIDYYLKFTIRFTAEQNRLSIKFTDITQAQADTGSMPNTGFGPLGTFWGATAPDAYKAAEQVANTIFQCVAST